MAVSPTFKKRQRENKLRERAQMKREHRQQRAVERKLSKAAGQADNALSLAQEIEQAPSDESDGETHTDAPRHER